jgi:putative DNA primase/helicase
VSSPAISIHRGNGKSPEAAVSIRPRLTSVKLSEVPVEQIDWLWQGHIALRKLHLWFGWPGLGKSFVMTDITARLTIESPMPDGSPAVNACDVLLLSGEDGLADTLRPRIEAHGGDTSRVHALKSKQTVRGGESAEMPISLETDCPLLEEYLREHPAIRLLVIDPISQFMGGVDSHKNAEVRAVLGRLAAVAEACNVAIVYIDHMSKRESGNALCRSMGSLAFVAQARIARVFVADPESPGRTLLLSAKSNLAALMPGLAFRIVEGASGHAVQWETGAVDITADEALAERRGPSPDRFNEAKQWVLDALAAGPVESTALETQAAAAGISMPTLRRARAALSSKGEKKIKSTKRGKPPKWFVSLQGAQQSPGPTT